MLSAQLRSFAFLGNNFLLGSTLEPPALLVYSLEQSPADGTSQADTHLLRFLFGTPFQDTTDILLASDPSSGWSPSPGLQVPFQIADDERMIAMNVQFFLDRDVYLCETSLIPTNTLLRYIESHSIKEGQDDVDWESYGPLLSERVPGHGRWDTWTCFVFGMRSILPRPVYLDGKPMIIVRDLSPRRCSRASREERNESNALYQATGGGRRKPYPRSILKCVPLPESIEDPQNVCFMISEDGIVALEEVCHWKTCVFIAARLTRLACRETPESFICLRSDQVSLDRDNRLTVFVRVVIRFISPKISSS